MKFISVADITAKEASSDNYMTKIDIDKTSTKKLVKMIASKGKDDELLSVLNVLGQDIEKIDTASYSYIHLGNDLSFSDLSRGEQVFLVSYAAKIVKEPIYLQYDIMQLTKTALRKYYDIFKDCDNIYIIYAAESELDYLTYAMQGRIK